MSRSLSAAARRLGTEEATSKLGGRRVRKRSEREQDVWSLVHVPEADYALRFMGNALSRVRLVPALIIDSDEPPVSMKDALEDPDIDVPPQLVADAQAELERLARGAGGQARLMRRFGQLLTAVGNSWLVGQDGVDGREMWEVLSTSNLPKDASGRGLMVKRSQGDPGSLLPDDATLIRVWQEDARWPDDPDTGMFAVLKELEELEIYDRQFRAVGRSRSTSGILALPAELSPQTPPRAVPGGSGAGPTTDPTDQKPVDGWTAFEMALAKSLLTPTEDDGSAASVVPHIIIGNAQWIEKIRHIKLDREIDNQAIARMDFLIRRVAHGINLPIEVLLGLADVNHWGQWLISDDTYRAHVEPTAQIPASGLGFEWLQPALLAAGHDPEWVERCTFGLNPSQLVVRPNRAQDAQAAHDRLAISDAAYRRYLSFPDSDAPDEEERAERLALKRGQVSAELLAQLLDRTGVVTDPPLEVTDGDGGGSAGLPTGDDDGNRPEDGGEALPASEPARSLTAAAVEIPGLGDRLAAVEARLRDRLVVAASDSLRAALRRAGNRLRGAVQADEDLRREVNGEPAEEVGRILGADRAPVADTDELLEGAFEDLRPRWDEWTAQAEQEMAAVVAQRLDVPTGDVEAAVTAEGDGGQGWEALFLALMALASSRVFAAAAADEGEVDASVDVPASLVRDALSVAGGASAAFVPSGSAQQAGPPGLLTGPRWLAALRALGLFADRWMWQTGFPSVPFPPHQRLEGTTFDRWDDPQLVNGGRFPATSFYYPGDHRGCQCSAVPSFVGLGL